jgi:hypothetical protein
MSKESLGSLNANQQDADELDRLLAKVYSVEIKAAADEQQRIADEKYVAEQLAKRGKKS